MLNPKTLRIGKMYFAEGRELPVEYIGRSEIGYGFDFGGGDHRFYNEELAVTALTPVEPDEPVPETSKKTKDAPEGYVWKIKDMSPLMRTILVNVFLISGSAAGIFAIGLFVYLHSNK